MGRRNVLGALNRDSDEESDAEEQEVLDKRLENLRSKYINKQKVLILSSRGITYRYRHLMLDLLSILPHMRKDAKVDSKKNLQLINEAAEVKNCTHAVFFDVRKGTHLYMWMCKVPNGPSLKFQVLNVHTMNELNFTGNCLKGSRAVLSFCKKFDATPSGALMKEVIQQIFNVPNYHPRCRPFIDHVFSFTLLDNKIWFRHYQVLEEYDVSLKKNAPTMVEIGPRFVLNPIFILSGSFCGSPIWENPHYISPVFTRKMEKLAKDRVSLSKKQQKKKQNSTIQTAFSDPLDQVFSNK